MIREVLMSASFSWVDSEKVIRGSILTAFFLVINVIHRGPLTNFLEKQFDQAIGSKGSNCFSERDERGPYQ